jgi:hypothetical protein
MVHNRLTHLISLSLDVCRRRYAMARPNCAVEVNHKTGRDVGLAESGFALPALSALFKRYRMATLARGINGI